MKHYMRIQTPARGFSTGATADLDIRVEG